MIQKQQRLLLDDFVKNQQQQTTTITTIRQNNKLQEQKQIKYNEDYQNKIRIQQNNKSLNNNVNNNSIQLLNQLETSLNVQILQLNQKQLISHHQNNNNSHKKINLNLNNPQDRALQLSFRMNKLRIQKQKKVQSQLQKYYILKQSLNPKKPYLNTNHKNINHKYPKQTLNPILKSTSLQYQTSFNSSNSILSSSPQKETQKFKSNIHKQKQILQRSILLNHKNHIKKFIKQLIIQIVFQAIDKIQKKKAFYFHRSPKFVQKNISITNSKPYQYGPSNYNTIQHRYQQYRQQHNKYIKDHNRSLKLKKIRNRNDIINNNIKYEFQDFGKQFNIDSKFLNNSFRSKIIKQQKEKKMQGILQYQKMQEMLQKRRVYNDYQHLLKQSKNSFSNKINKDIQQYIFSIIVSDPDHNKISQEQIRQRLQDVKSRKFSTDSHYTINLITHQLLMKSQQNKQQNKIIQDKKRVSTIVDLQLEDQGKYQKLQSKNYGKQEDESSNQQNNLKQSQISQEKKQNQKQKTDFQQSSVQESQLQQENLQKRKQKQEELNQFASITPIAKISKSIKMKQLQLPKANIQTQNLKINQVKVTQSHQKIQQKNKNNINFLQLIMQQTKTNQNLITNINKNNYQDNDKQSQFSFNPQTNHLPKKQLQNFDNHYNKMKKQQQTKNIKNNTLSEKSESKVRNHSHSLSQNQQISLIKYKQAQSNIQQSEIQDISDFSNQIKLTTFLQAQLSINQDQQRQRSDELSNVIKKQSNQNLILILKS